MLRYVSEQNLQLEYKIDSSNKRSLAIGVDTVRVMVNVSSLALML